LAYATAPGTVAYDGRFDGRGDNSPYAGALAKAMLMPNTPVETVFKKVRISVINETDEKQVPWESSSLTGEFMFNPDLAVTSAPDADEDFWHSIKDTDDHTLFRSYLMKFPNGKYLIEAGNKLNTLLAAEAAAQRK
jgi:uncharacterized caspase-like protein